jgi:monoamine oxidase
LASYTWGDESLRWDALPDAKRVEYALKDLERIHGDVAAREFIKGTSYSWLHDEYTRGAFALFQPGQQTEFMPYIAAPEGRVHFAGEHTTLKHAWIEGAIESGVRAAREVAEALAVEAGPRVAYTEASGVELGLPDLSLQNALVAVRSVTRPHGKTRETRILRV